MGRKSRKQIKGERDERLELVLKDPEYRREYTSLDNRMKERGRDIRKLPPRASDGVETVAEYQRLCEKYGLAFLVDPEKERTPYDFPSLLSPEIIRAIPYRKPNLIKQPFDPGNPNVTKGEMDPSGYLRREHEPQKPYQEPKQTGPGTDLDAKYGKPRYLTVEIDTWNKKEMISDALMRTLESLEKHSIVIFNSRLRLDSERDAIEVKRLRDDEGKSWPEIARTRWPDEYEKLEKIREEDKARYENEREIHNQRVQELWDYGIGMSKAEARKKAVKELGPLKRMSENPLIQKAKRLYRK
jgi:hypothetical protein